jgi:DNA polymerase
MGALKPRLVVLLGATAARAVLHRNVKIGDERGRMLQLAGGVQAIVTIHPSYLLRLPDAALARDEYARFVEDLRLAAPFG